MNRFVAANLPLGFDKLLKIMLFVSWSDCSDSVLSFSDVTKETSIYDEDIQHIKTLRRYLLYSVGFLIKALLVLLSDILLKNSGSREHIAGIMHATTPQTFALEWNG